MQLALAQAKYPTPAERSAFYQQLESRLNAVPGISAASLTTALPLSGGAVRDLSIDGRSPVAGERLPEVSMLTVGTRYFDTLGVRLLRGRAFISDDGLAGREAAIVNERFVAMYFPDVDPLGRRIRLTAGNAPVETPSWMTIVGISPTIRQRSGSESAPDPVVYVPYPAQPLPLVTLIVRSASDPAAAASRLREEVQALDPDLPVFDVMTVDEWLAYLRSPERVFGTLFAVFAGIALALAAVGMYAVTAYSIAQRTQEIGLRMALGAQARQVWWLVIRRVLVRLAIGLALGLAGGLGVGRLLSGVLGASGNDGVTLMSVTTLLVAAMLAACFWPVLRATRLNPVLALRHE
jgi:predicted permease